MAGEFDNAYIDVDALDADFTATTGLDITNDPFSVSASETYIPDYDIPAAYGSAIDVGAPSQPAGNSWYENVGNFAFNTVPGAISDFLSPQQDSLESILGGLTRPGAGASQSELDDYKLVRNQAVLDYRSDRNEASINPGTWGFQEWSTLGIAGLGLYEYLENKKARKDVAKANTPKARAEAQIEYSNTLRDAGLDRFGDPLTDVEASAESSGGGAISTGNHSTNPFLT